MKELLEPKVAIGLDSTVEDLELTSATISSTDNLIEVYKLFDNNPSLTGIIVLKNNKYFKLLSRNRFFKSMSNQFMFDLYMRRSVGSYFEDHDKDEVLVIPRHTSILEAANLALKRTQAQQKDPIVISFEDCSVKLLDIYNLLLAQIHVHKMTLALLNEANEFKKEVLNMIAHDLRTPIGSIIGFSEELMDMNIDEQGSIFLKYLNNSAKQINELVNELLKSVISDATHYDLNISTFKLNELIESVIFTLRKSLSGKEQKMIFNTFSDSVEITADKIKIKEVIENLLTNAIKYSGFGRTTSIALEEQGSIIYIVVMDEGLGLSEDDLKKIFGKFQRLSAKPTSGESSTGLGLYLVKQIVEQHGGSIIVTSMLGKGTTFKVALPKYYELK